MVPLQWDFRCWDQWNLTTRRSNAMQNMNNDSSTGKTFSLLVIFANGRGTLIGFYFKPKKISLIVGIETPTWSDVYKVWAVCVIWAQTIRNFAVVIPSQIEAVQVNTWLHPQKYSSRRTTAMPNLRILQHGKSTLYSLSQTHFKLTSQVHQGKRNIYQGVRGSQNLQATFWVSLSVYRSTWTYSSDLHYCCYAWLWTSNTCQSFEKELKTLWVFLSRRHI